MKKPRATRRKPAARAPRRRDPIDAALELATLQGWTVTTMADIARQSGVPLDELLRSHPSKMALLAAFMQRIDLAMIAGVAPAEGESARDRLFEVVMRRFDALGPYKGGVRAIARDCLWDPPALACLALGPMHRSLVWMLEAAGLGSEGLRGALRLKGLAVIYGNAFRVWLDDESPDLARTMAALDRSLRRAESAWTSLIGLLGRAA